MNVNLLPKINGEYIPDYPLADMTTIKVGGNAEFFIKFNNIKDFSNFIKLKNKDVKLTIIGAGSNMIIPDEGIKGVVTTLDFLNEVTVKNNLLTAGAGATCGKVARTARNANLAGLAFYAGIPGTIGGALKMNAGCYGQETKDLLKSVQVITNHGELKNLNPEEIEFSYRHSNLPAGWFFTGATFELQAGDKQKIRQEMQSINAERRESQPLDMPSSGSWFKNPTVNGKKLSAWQVVEKAGCRGMQVGQAQVSKKHCNFFVNLGGATASDFAELSKQVEAKILKTQGIKMVKEVRFL